jgi:hypothetical protein
MLSAEYGIAFLENPYGLLPGMSVPLQPFDQSNPHAEGEEHSTLPLVSK